MTTQKKVKITRAELERNLRETEAQLIHCLHFADAELHKASVDKLGGSAVIITLHFLGGREVTKPFAIDGGLSSETIEAIRADIRRTYLGKTEFKPKGV